MRYGYAAIVFGCGEVAGLIIFWALGRHFTPDRSGRPDVGAALKGILERLVLFTALLHGYPQMLIAFGTMKLGTRLHHEQDSEISNSYFLVGNLISILLAMLYTIITNALCKT